MKMIWMPILLLLLLQGCSGYGTRKQPAPVTKTGAPAVVRPAVEPAPVEEEDQAEVYAYRQEPAPAFVPRPLEPTPIPAPSPQEPAAAAVPKPQEQAPAPAPAPAYAPSPPVVALVERAEAQRAAGDLTGASATLERALGIEPRNPNLLNRLARVRLQQGSYSQADSLASKSNALAGDDPALHQDNLSIIAEARKASAP